MYNRVIYNRMACGKGWMQLLVPNLPLCHYGQEGFFIYTHPLNCRPNVFLLHLACIASVSSQVRRESWDESKKKKRNDKRFLFSPPPPPSTFCFFFCSRSNFRAVTRLETLATQAMLHLPNVQGRKRNSADGF